MIDIHNHVLFGVDDGAATLQDSIEMLKLASEEGVLAIIATPHYPVTRKVEVLKENYETLCRQIDDMELPIKLYLGHEAVLDDRLLDELKSGVCNTLAGSRYVLIESYLNSQFYIMQSLLYQIIISGYVPILAHCERMIDCKEDVRKLMELKKMGCLLQMNSHTLLKPKGLFKRKWVHRLVKDGHISFMASDAHNMSTRKPSLQQAYSKVAKKYGVNTAKNLFFKNPSKILENAETL